MKKDNILSVEDKVILIFGGCGLIGSEFSKHLLNQKAKILDANNLFFQIALKLHWWEAHTPLYVLEF